MSKPLSDDCPFPSDVHDDGAVVYVTIGIPKHNNSVTDILSGLRILLRGAAQPDTTINALSLPQRVAVRSVAYPSGITGPYNKVAAIKMVREYTGMGLKEARDWVEEHIEGKP